MGTHTAPAWLVHCSASSKLNHNTLLPLLQGAEYVDGFAGGASGGGLGSRGRCFRCGQAGHWEDACPLLAARIADQEAELAAWRGNELAADASAVPAGGGTEQQQSLNPVEGAGSAGTAGLSLPATALVGYPQHRAAAAAAAAVAAGNAPPPQPAALREAAPPLSEARLRELTGVPADAPWLPASLSDEALAAVLLSVWGHTGFRGRQLELIRGALEGRSMLGVLPTGLGKSLTYQMPALLMQGEHPACG